METAEERLPSRAIVKSRPSRVAPVIGLLRIEEDLVRHLQNLRLSLVVSAVYSLVAMALFMLLPRLDRVAVWSLLPCIIYLPYANWWGYAVWRANPDIEPRTPG